MIKQCTFDFLASAGVTNILKNEFVRLLAPAVGGSRKALVRCDLMP